MLFTAAMVFCSFVEFMDVLNKNVDNSTLCIQWYFMALRFGPIAAEVVFLLFVCVVHGKINILYSEGTTMVVSRMSEAHRMSSFTASVEVPSIRESEALNESNQDSSKKSKDTDESIIRYET